MPTETCILTTKDFTILEVMRDRCLDCDDPLAPILKKKIEFAQVVFREDVPEDVATLSSRVTFSIDGCDPDTRVISHDRTASPVGMFLPITTPRGLALLGLAENQEFMLTNSDGADERMLLEKVQYQPEAAKREKEALTNLLVPPRRNASLKPSRGALYGHPRPASEGPGGFDDPGPSAAGAGARGRCTWQAARVYGAFRRRNEATRDKHRPDIALPNPEANMMNEPDLPPVVIPASDHERLQAIARSLAEQSDPLAGALLQELARAELREPDDVPEQTVSLDRFVTYRVPGSDRPERRLLIHPEDGMWPPAELSVATPLGITLLGLSAGDRMPVLGSDLRAPPWVEVLAVGRAATSGITRRPAGSNAKSWLTPLAEPRQ